MRYDLRKLQLTELGMFKDVADFCDDKGIVYYMSSGTMLGAARHQGFIPWDDDIDICMDVRNYKKFLKLAPTGLPEKYFVQNYRTDPKVSIRWTKVRMNGTTSMERDSTGYDIHYGICMDIFVMAGIPETVVKAKIQKVASIIMSILLEKYLSRVKKRPLSRLEKLIYAVSPECLRRKIIALLEIFVLVDTEKCKQCYNTYFPFPEIARKYESRIFSPSDRVKMQFEDQKFWAFGKWEQYLTDDYGDWRTPPPKDQRGAHGDIIVDFDHDYKMYYTGE